MTMCKVTAIISQMQSNKKVISIILAYKWISPEIHQSAFRVTSSVEHSEHSFNSRYMKGLSITSN